MAPCGTQPGRAAARGDERQVRRRRGGYRRGASVHDLRGRDPVGVVLRHAERAPRGAGRRQGLPPRRTGPAGLAQVGAALARPVLRALRRQGDCAGATQGHASRPLRREPRRGRRGQLDGRRLLQGESHPRQAFRGVQGASRRRDHARQGSDPNSPGGRATVIPELGSAAAIVALALALWGAVAAATGARTGRPALVLSAQHAALGVFVLVTACFALLTYAFLIFDFSVRYVAINTNLGTPFYYRITGVWGALEGSIILWTWMLALYTLIVILRHRESAHELYPWVLTVMLSVMAFFLLVITVAAPPFARLTPVPADGRGLNPLLAAPGMITHPVALYLGFTGLTVPFAFAMAALCTGRVGDAWITLTRRWTIVAWYFLSLGLLIGGWWSYHVLGWGGYWAWDPVENAAFMPWLTGTAFLHSVMIQERRRMLKLWNIGLVI